LVVMCPNDPQVEFDTGSPTWSLTSLILQSAVCIMTFVKNRILHWQATLRVKLHDYPA